MVAALDGATDSGGQVGTQGDGRSLKRGHDRPFGTAIETHILNVERTLYAIQPAVIRQPYALLVTAQQQ